MNTVQLHLALTHVPVILSLVGMIMLIVAFFVKNTTLTKISYMLILTAGIAAMPVFFSGEGAEEAVENLPGISDAVIEKHEEVAKLAMISIAAAGLLALAALIMVRWSRILKIFVLMVAIISGGLMVQTAHLGGQIRHTEIRNGFALQNESAGGSENGNVDGNRQKDDDD